MAGQPTTTVETPVSPAPGPPTLQTPGVVGLHKVGDYTILGILGSGGMGVVYRAYDPKFCREVALKMLRLSGGDPFSEDLLRFRQEAETLGRLQHPNVVSVFDFGMHEGAPFLVMELVAGGTLGDELRGQPQAPRKAAETVEVLARALQAVHEVGIIHRDLKPGNVLLTADHTLKVTDFGLAKQLGSGSGPTVTGAIMGTPEYMAPEQARGDSKAVTAAADVWALGAILYELLTGKPPFRGATWKETLEQVCQDDPAPPSRIVPRLPRDLQTVCLMCLHKNPARRYPSAKALADDLRAYLDGLPVKARPTGMMERAYRAVLRRPLTAALLFSGTVITVLMVVLGFVIAEGRRAQEVGRLREAARGKELEAEAAKSLEEIFRLVLRSDLTTEAGLQQVKTLLMEKSAQFEGQTGAAPTVRRTPLANIFLDLAVKMRLRGVSGDLRRETLDHAAALAAADPEDDPQARFTLAGIRSEQGWALSDRGHYDKAEAVIQEGLGLLTRRLEGWPEDEYTRRRAELLHRLAELQSRDDPASVKAQALYEEARDLRRGLSQEDDADEYGDRANLARTLGYLGDLYLEQQDFKQADLAYWESHRIRERLHLHSPKNAERQFQLGRSWANFGGYQARRRSLSTALYFLEQSRRVREDMVGHHRDNGPYNKELAGVLNQQAELLLFVGERDRASALADRAGKLMRALLAEAESHRDPGARANLARSLAVQARVALVQNRPPEAQRHAAEARDALGDVRSDRTGLRYGLLAEELYDEAAALAILAGFGAAPEDRAKGSLEAAYRAGFRRLAAEEVNRDLAFRNLREQRWFQQLTTGPSSNPEPGRRPE